MKRMLLERECVFTYAGLTLCIVSVFVFMCVFSTFINFYTLSIGFTVNHDAVHHKQYKVRTTFPENVFFLFKNTKSVIIFTTVSPFLLIRLFNNLVLQVEYFTILDTGLQHMSP